MNFRRLLRHLYTSRMTLRRTFPAASMRAIEDVIKRSETSHDGEIRFAVEAALHIVPLLSDRSARERAVEVFSHLRIWDTACNNGVLIYLLLADRNVEIVADRGIHTKVGTEEWERICREMEAAFQQGQFEEGVIAGIGAISRCLQEHFPTERSGGENELDDKPVVL